MTIVYALVLVAGVTATAVLSVRPWLAPWGVVFLFGTTAELRLRISGSFGATKDAYVLLLFALALVAVLRGKVSLPARLPPLAVWSPLAALVLLYLLNLGGSPGAPWLFGTRLLLEPLLLLVIGLVTPLPARALRHLVWAMCVFLFAEAVLAWVQQAVGPDALVYRWGYAFGSQVRLTTGGALRSPGTFEEAFSLTAHAILGLCVACTIASRRQSVILWSAALAILAATQVRTAVLQIAALSLLLLLRRGKVAAAALGVVAAGSAALLVSALFLSSPSIPGAPSKPLLSTLNGRFDAWGVAYQGTSTLLRGNGVGALGAGSTRAGQGLVATTPRYDPNRESTPLFAGDPAFIDSSWLQVLSDVGLAGMLALLAWVAALVVWLWTQASYRLAPAWLALGVVAVSTVDWLSRTTLASYPTGFTTFYIIGLATGASLAARAVRARVSGLASVQDS